MAGPLAGLSDLAAGLRGGLRQARRLVSKAVPDRLLLAPQDLRFADPAIATDMYSGHYILAGRTVLTRGASPFSAVAPSVEWSVELNGFGWLRHFQASDSAIIRAHGRALVQEWLSSQEIRSSHVARAPGTVARRVLSLLVNSPVLLEQADHAYYRRVLQALAADASRLETFAAQQCWGPARVAAAIALVNYTLCAMTGDSEWRRASRLLAEALDHFILPDGGPLSRNPQDAVEIAIDLLPLRNAYAARGRTPPPELQQALDRVMQFIRMMRHGDGALALFNGMGVTQMDVIGALLALDDARGTPSASAPHAGYQRFDRGGTTLIADCGGAPPAASAGSAHAGSGAFELSWRHQRIVVNCGAPPAGLDAMREALRDTPAHSTLCIEGLSSARFVARRRPEGGMRRLLADAAGTPTWSRSETEAGETLQISHPGYRSQTGQVHERTITVSGDGDSIAGMDRLVGAGRRRQESLPPVCLRFHLHPSVKGTRSGESDIVILDLPDGAQWAFVADGASVSIEDSVFFGGLERQRRATQLVVALDDPEAGVSWQFSRMA